MGREDLVNHHQEDMKEHSELPHYSITYCCSSDIKSSEGNIITNVTYEDQKTKYVKHYSHHLCHQSSQSKGFCSPL